ncbi:unnamed protein product [Nesidiocoris tenuis]|nr:unnamed protein product [Nesidiocoris tenuis]CAB0008780.1 unnamed protein product [Nesidiocoris tenuis]
MGSHQHQTTNPSVVQTLDEMDFERGLWYPAMQGDLAELDKLLTRGADVNKTDKSGYTALHYAARGGDLAVVQKLLRAGANVNLKTKAGLATPLHRAASAGRLEVVKLLLDNGAEKVPIDSDGRTPLHRSAASGHEGISLLLVREAPEATKIRDSKGLSPADVAQNMGHKSLCRIIRNSVAGASSSRTPSPSSPPRSRSKSP